MQELFTFALSVFMAFFAIMNPIANTSIFLGLADGYTRRQKTQIARTACLTAFFLVASFTLAGKYIFELFGISIPAFKITGGILIFYVGFEMLMSKKSSVHSNSTEEDTLEHQESTDIAIPPNCLPIEQSQQSIDNNIAISPLATPILAGPGAIVTAMNYVANANMVHIVIVIAVFALMIALTYFAFSLGDLIVKTMGENLIAVIGKLMGLILAVIGTGMVISGIQLAFNLTGLS